MFYNKHKIIIIIITSAQIDISRVKSIIEKKTQIVLLVDFFATTSSRKLLQLLLRTRT